MTADQSQTGNGSAPAEAIQDDRNLAMLAHLLAIVLGFIGPLVI